ncbi:MAG: hypothetical protein E7L01_23960 [Paenibacillus macerans]|uniref:Uncharacterized protein n=1 Tax=Paenibacillus macerans TaxID=44252 RepID=A0A090Y794_PAEMA|nr:hypothetical protein [Paenibacillus macerans]KFM94603.1 hypothetical protein DJ90_1301 [Paenibacillus macerans]MCY7557859.1 hypothetical protein [Paenibacillus macerans]MDU7476368.1 hypothetical protein [Paenibacillus macerans]MEC0153450.1 hypothetical protein [Paenibacillus macerans]MEC0331713.1 hypothetical protein [Paenibacillus macerans]
MAGQFWRKWFGANDQVNDRVNEVDDRLRKLELELEKLKVQDIGRSIIEELQKLRRTMVKLAEAEEQRQKQPPIHIETLDIEKVLIDRVVTNNNIGALGVKELAGRLNIGANYGQGAETAAMPNKEKVAALLQSYGEKPLTNGKSNEPPAVNIKGRSTRA